MSALSILTSRGLHAAIEGDRLTVFPADRLDDQLRDYIRKNKPVLMQELSGRWNAELAADGYVWCMDCAHWNGEDCTHKDNPYREHEPKCARFCKWYRGAE